MVPIKVPGERDREREGRIKNRRDEKETFKLVQVHKIKGLLYASDEVLLY